jgi:hypothetical protein
VILLDLGGGTAVYNLQCLFFNISNPFVVSIGLLLC